MGAYLNLPEVFYNSMRGSKFLPDYNVQYLLSFTFKPKKRNWNDEKHAIYDEQEDCAI